MKARYILVSFIGVVLVCALSFFLLDRPAAFYFHAMPDSRKEFFEIATRLGISTWYIVASAAAFICFKFIRKNEMRSNRALLVFLSVALSGLLVDLLKYCLGRARPSMLFEANAYGFYFLHTRYGFTSCPSGHAATIAALALALYYLYPKGKYLYTAAAILVMASRVVLTAHFPSDVAAGAYVGLLTTYCLKFGLEAKGFGVGPQREAVEE